VGGVKSNLNIFLPKPQIIIVKSTKTVSKMTIKWASNRDWKIKNSLINNPDGGIAVAEIKARSNKIAPTLLYLK
jgi:hypothetical protein